MKSSDLPDTVKFPDNFKKSLPENFDGICDFETSSQGVNRRGISPMDFDEVIEINSHYLIFETKDPGKETPKGQRMCLERIQNAKSFTVIFQQGKRKAIKLECLWPDGKRQFLDGDRKKEIVRRWADAAEADKLPSVNHGKCKICGAYLCDNCKIANAGWEWPWEKENK